MAEKITAEKLVELGVAPAAAKKLAARAGKLLDGPSPEEAWAELSRKVLTPKLPFEVHSCLYRAVYAGRDASAGPGPAWFPTEKAVAAANLTSLASEVGLGSYEELHAWSVRERAAFWGKMAQRLDIRFAKPYRSAMDDSRSAVSPEWFAGAEMNISTSCFGAPADSPAIVSGSPDGSLSTLSVAELESLVNRVAGSLVEAGLVPGDAVAIDMPMNPEAVAAYLGIVRAGCAVVGIADSFAPDEVAKRLKLGSARAVFTQDFIAYGTKRLPLFEKVAAAGAPRAIVLGCEGDPAVKLRPGDAAWSDFLRDDDAFDPVMRAPGALSNVLFSSGTTGDPKAIPWPQSAPVKCAADAWLHQDVRPGDVVAWPTSLGWMMGPWLIYAALVNRAAIALYRGAPTGREFAKFVQDAKVTMLGLVPSLVKAWRGSGCVDGLDWSSVRCFSSTGECSNAQDMLWLSSRAGYRPVIEYCGGTELAGGYITGTVVQPAAPATFTTPTMGLDFVILDEHGEPADVGEVFLVPPSVGMSSQLLNRDHDEVYYRGAPRGPGGEQLRRHGDEIERLPGGSYRAHGRVDDTMNLGGIKVSSAELERAVAGVEGVVETAAVAVTPPGGGASWLVIFAVLQESGAPDPEEIRKAMQARIRERLNPLFKIHEVVAVDALPRTASNKVMRRKLRARYRPGG